MSALALALVACCAMVCGTYLSKRHYDAREMALLSGSRDSERLDKVDHKLSSLRSEVDSLRAQVALRGM